MEFPPILLRFKICNNEDTFYFEFLRRFIENTGVRRFDQVYGIPHMNLFQFVPEKRRADANR